jgi:uncharacterized protein (TIGR03032 family)
MMPLRSKQAITSPGLPEWLQEQDISLVLSTYRANRLIFIGRDHDSNLKLEERLFDRPMGLFVSKQSIWMAGRSHIWRIDNLLGKDGEHEGADNIYVPSASFLTGEVNAHELVITTDNEPLFVNTVFSCLATIKPGCSFQPIWKPSFIDALVAEDRCHLNGIAMKDDIPTWATACSSKNETTSWRRERIGNGIVIHIPSDEIACSGLTMPHSPRWHNKKLWLLNSGTGDLGWVENNQFQPICQLPGFARGLAFHNNFALVGLSKLRSRVFTGLPLEQRLLTSQENPQGICGLQVIDLNNGKIIQSIHLPEPIDELFDLAVLPGVRQPRMVSLTDENLDTLVKLPTQKNLVRIRPNTPSGRPHQGPPVKRTGMPLTEKPERVQKTSKLQYQRIFQLTRDNLTPYASLTFPPLTAGSNALKRLHGNLMGVSAMHNGEMVGLVIAECDEYLNAQVTSLMVSLEWRNQGIGTTLIHHLCNLLKEENCQRLSLRYQAPLQGNMIMESLLKRLGWRNPQQELLLLKGEAHRLAKINWHKNFPLPEQYTISRWKEEYGEDAENTDAPQELKDTIKTERVETNTSFALFHNEQLVGWLISHRTGKHSLRYSSLFVAQRHRQRGQALHLISIACKAQQQLGIQIARAGIAPKSQAAIRLLKRHGYLHLTEIKQSMFSWVILDKN